MVLTLIRGEIAPRQTMDDRPLQQPRLTAYLATNRLFLNRHLAVAQHNLRSLHSDADAALQAIEEDKQVDLDYKTALREVVTYMMEDPRSISRALNILWVVRSLERIGDHAKNLCEQIVFVVKGKDIRHR